MIIIINGFYFVVFDPSLEDCKEYRELHGAYCALVSFVTWWILCYKNTDWLCSTSCT